MLQTALVSHFIRLRTRCAYSGTPGSLALAVPSLCLAGRGGEQLFIHCRQGIFGHTVKGNTSLGPFSPMPYPQAYELPALADQAEFSRKSIKAITAAPRSATSSIRTALS